jgi:hypothetical protein
VDPTLGPFQPPSADSFEAFAQRMLARPGERHAVHAAWRIGEPYRDVPVPIIRVRAARSVGLPAAPVLGAVPRWLGGTPRRAVAVMLLAALVVLVGGSALGAAGIGALVALLLVLAATVTQVWRTRAAMARLTSQDTLGAIGRAVADALATTGRIDATAGAARVRVGPQEDGYQRCQLEGASTADAERFAEAVEEVLAPLWEPRWVIGRRVIDGPPSLMGAARALLAGIVGRRTASAVVYHAVPGALASSRERVAAFERAWTTWVTLGEHAVRAADPAGEGILAAHRGEDPFRIETQRRTLWT